MNSLSLLKNYPWEQHGTGFEVICSALRYFEEE